MSSMAAQRLGLHDRGFVAPGMAADLIVFDPDVIRDAADFGSDAMRYAEGVDYLLVNGTLVIDDGALLDVNAGRVLRRGGR
jgi:N-acyl-D-amino-acid deacylase